jgi:hypothetical protein
MGKHLGKKFRMAHHIRRGARRMAYGVVVRADAWRRASRRALRREE